MVCLHQKVHCAAHQKLESGGRREESVWQQENQETILRIVTREVTFKAAILKVNSIPCGWNYGSPVVVHGCMGKGMKDYNMRGYRMTLSLVTYNELLCACQHYYSPFYDIQPYLELLCMFYESVSLFVVSSCRWSAQEVQGLAPRPSPPGRWSISVCNTEETTVIEHVQSIVQWILESK